MNIRIKKILCFVTALFMWLGIFVLTPTFTDAHTVFATPANNTSSATSSTQKKYPLLFDMDIQTGPQGGHTHPGAPGQIDSKFDIMWRNITITVTDSKGNVYNSEKQFLNTEKQSLGYARYGGEYVEGEELTVTVEPSEICDGYHISKDFTGDYKWLPNTTYSTFKLIFKKNRSNYMAARIAFGYMDVKFDLQGGSINGNKAPIVQRVKKDNSVDFPAVPTKEGLYFKGWYTQVPMLLNGNPYPRGLGGKIFYWTNKSIFSDYSCDWVVWNDTTIDPMYDETFLLRAQYEAEVTFVSQGGSEVPSKRVVEGNSLGKAMPQNPHKKNNIFKEWNTKPDGKGISFTADTPVNKNITLYAIYVPKMVAIDDIVPTLTVKDKVIDKGDTLELKSLVLSTHDKKDGDLLAKVQVLDKGGFDNNKIGSYTVTFKVTNSVGASMTKKVTVTVKMKTSTTNVKPNKAQEIIPKTGETTSFTSLFVILGLAIIGGIILYKKKMIEE